MATKPDIECDILIIGAGQAGSTLARQLHIQQPDLHILQVEKKRAFDLWVGEAMTESWDDYMVRYLRLGSYLEMHTMQKHGLRFMFDSEAKDIPLHEMSEFGRGRMHVMSARVLDRAKFDQDMVDINRKSGIEVLLGTRVLGRAGDESILIDRDNGHRVETSAGTIRCKYLVDAAGYSSPLSNVLGLTEPRDENYQIGSYWARYEGFVNMDELGPNEWRERVNHTQRYLSATTFMYDGYWLWHIPVSDTMTSLGVVFDHKIEPLTIKNGDQLTTFLRKHQCMRDILGDSPTAVDFMGLKNLARRTKQQYSEDRWYLSGLSAMFVDPMGASNSWLYPQQNKFIGWLIDADRKGNTVKVRRYIRYFEEYLRRIYRGLAHTFGQYGIWGSYDLTAPYIGARLSAFFSSIVSADQTDFRNFLALIEKHGDDDEKVWAEFTHTGYWDAVLRLTYEMRDYLNKTGNYRTNNKGRWADQHFWENRPSVLERIYRQRNHQEEHELLLESHEEFLRIHAQRYFEIEGLSFNDKIFQSTVKPDWMEGQTIEELVKAMQEAQAKS